jgi:DNA helicase-2/ATP-dependent DNA helicase PcrA
MDSLIGHIASAYHQGLGLPADVAAWIRQQRPAGAGYTAVALKVAAFLQQHPMIAAALVRRHSVVI